MKIAIFGGMGFIGSSLSNLFYSKGYDVTILTQNKKNKSNILVSNKIKIIEIKYNYKKLKKINFKKFDRIHFLSGNPSPANSNKSPDFDLSTTNKFTQILLELLRLQRFKGSIWIASSVAVYGNQKGLLKEKEICDPISIYGISKLFSEKTALLYYKKFFLNIGIYRIFSTYGPGLKRQLIYDVINKIQNNNQEVQIIGSGLERRDLTYIEDVVKGIFKLNKHIPKGEIFNIGSGKSYSVRYVVKKIMNLMNKKLIIKYSNSLRGYDADNWKASITKIKKFGYKPSVSLEVGLKKTIEHYFKNNK
tara:strand:- start:110 stop:1024 length:915 start_codon:yes stop_codon:yes gene_type:complete